MAAGDTSNQTDPTTVRRLHTPRPSCSIAWIACAQSFKLGTSRMRKSSGRILRVLRYYSMLVEARDVVVWALRDFFAEPG
jgi:hypothetical protein